MPDDQAGHIVHGVQRLIGGKDLTECQHVVVQNADIGLVQDLCATVVPASPASFSARRS